LVKLKHQEYESVKAEMEDVRDKAVVGSLMYVVVATKVDLAFLLSVVSRYMAKSGPMRWVVVKTIMQYLQSTLRAKTVGT